MNRFMISCFIAATAVACAHDNVQTQPAATAYRYQEKDTTSAQSVRKAQAALNDRGFSVEKNGVMDTRTKTALQSFQKNQNLAQTGELDAATRAQLDVDSDDDVSKRDIKNADPRTSEDQVPEVNSKMVP